MPFREQPNRLTATRRRLLKHLNCMADAAKSETLRSEATVTCQGFNNLRRGARDATDTRSPAVIPDKVRLARTFRNALRVAVKRFFAPPHRTPPETPSPRCARTGFQ